MEASAWTVKSGDTFKLGGIEYRATAAPTGEFNTYIKVVHLTGEYAGKASEVYIHSSQRVEILTRA